MLILTILLVQMTQLYSYKVNFNHPNCLDHTMHIPNEIYITHPLCSDGTIHIIYEVDLFHTNSSDDTIYTQRQKLSITNFVAIFSEQGGVIYKNIDKDNCVI